MMKGLATLFVMALTASAAHAGDVQVSNECFQKAGKAALNEAMKNISMNSFRALRLGMFDDQGGGSERVSPYSTQGNNIIVIVSTSASIHPEDNENEEYQISEFYSLKVLNAKACKLGAPQNVTPE